MRKVKVKLGEPVTAQCEEIPLHAGNGTVPMSVWRAVLFGTGVKVKKVTAGC